MRQMTLCSGLLTFTMYEGGMVTVSTRADQDDLVLLDDERVKLIAFLSEGVTA